VLRKLKCQNFWETKTKNWYYVINNIILKEKFRNF